MKDDTINVIDKLLDSEVLPILSKENANFYVKGAAIMVFSLGKALVHNERSKNLVSEIENDFIEAEIVD